MKEQNFKNNQRGIPFWGLIPVICFVIGFDQLTKWLAVVYLQGKPSFPLWRDVLHFTFVQNEGAAFGMLKDNRWVFMIISTVALIGLSVYLFGFCKEGGWVKISLAMIIGGGIGNMIDRVALGYVVDFIDFTLIDFAVFNVADSFVCVGSGILIAYLLLEQILEIRRARRDRLKGIIVDALNESVVTVEIKKEAAENAQAPEQEAKADTASANTQADRLEDPANGPTDV